MPSKRNEHININHRDTSEPNEQFIHSKDECQPQIHLHLLQHETQQRMEPKIENNV